MRRGTFAIAPVAAAAAVAATVAVAAAAATAPRPAGAIAPRGVLPTFTVSPTSGDPGTVVTISATNTCFGGSATATVTLHDPANQQASQSNVDGSWSVQITVAAGTPGGTYAVTATCTGADELPSDYSYAPSSFTVLAASPSPTPSPTATATPTPSPTPTTAPTPTPTASPATAVSGEANFTG